ncbi:MAG: hypothetical protein P8Y97_16920, partial [Candidatus Lokiarchaeota archaeon]
FFKIALMCYLTKLGLLGSIHSYGLLESKFKFLPTLIYSFLGGLILSLVLIPSSIEITLSTNYYKINFQTLLLILIFIYNIIYFIISIYVQMKRYSQIAYKHMGYLLNLIIIILLVNTLMFLIYMVINLEIIRILYFIIYIGYLLLMTYTIIFKFDLFIVITNKIYNFIIFHRSGILLFAYDFQSKKEIDDSILKGSILIGINHILTNFRTQRDNLNLIKMKDRDIIFDYDIKHGYAVLLITDHKNKIIERAVKQFMDKFTFFI